MANVENSYCEVGDLRTGDIATPSYTTPEQYIKNAAEEIETALGHLYVTPFVIPVPPNENRPTVLWLKKANWLLASGRMILDVAATSESDNLHAYGKRMLDEAMQMIADVKGGQPLPGATEIDGDDQNEVTGPQIFNEDSESLVQGFYVGRRPYYGLGDPYPGIGYPPPAVPYG
jgi:hypothetical protein